MSMIVGVADRAPERDTGAETALTLAARIGSAALADADLRAWDVDGLLVHPAGAHLTPSTLAEFMGLHLTYGDIVDLGGATGVGMLWRAAAAMDAGMCSVCLCITAAPRSASVRPASEQDRSPYREFEVPYGNFGATEGYALIAARYEYQYGDTARPRAELAVAQRENAHAHPAAYFSGVRLTLEDVMSSAMVADPLRELDYGLPMGGAAAVLIVRADRIGDARQPAVPILGAGEAISHKAITYAQSMTDTAVAISAGRAFEAAGISPGHIRLASLYDSCTSAVLLTLEDAEFCPKGRAAAFLAEHDLSWRGDFAVNTHGGQLSFGHAEVAGGMSHVVEAVRQLQGRAQGRQVPELEFAFVHGIGGIMSEHASAVLGAPW